MSLLDRLRRFIGGAPFGGDRGDDVPLTPEARSKREQQRLEREAAAKPVGRPARRRRVQRIRRDVLEMVCEAARASHPNEFGATLRAEGDTVTELILVPGTLGGDSHAILPLGMLPVDSSIVGTVHSHPGPYAIPSSADEQLFRNFGHTHIIVAEPYNEHTWIAYDQDAREIELEVVED